MIKRYIFYVDIVTCDEIKKCCRNFYTSDEYCNKIMFEYKFNGVFKVSVYDDALYLLLKMLHGNQLKKTEKLD